MDQAMFIRNQHNPIITAKNLPYQANAVFNAGAADFGDEIVLLLRVESPSGRSHLIMARSEDGVRDWQVEEKALFHPEEGVPYESYGAEDCRLTWVEELRSWIVAYVGYSERGPGVALAKTRDFSTVERIGLIFPPDDKNPAMFPRTFNGLYALLHRPTIGGGSIWISYSPDLVFWGKSKQVMTPRGGPWWDAMRVGAGPPPIETDAGWLLIYHGVKEVAGGPIYRMGAALLDKDEPHKLMSRSHRWLLSPDEIYERRGDAPNVVFGCGSIVRNGELWLYYGAADCSVCLATVAVGDVLESLATDGIS